MDNKYRKALVEVIQVLNNAEDKLVEKIPKKFINFLYENQDKDYQVYIDFADEEWQEQLMDETRAILSLIYRDFIVSKEERQELLKEEKKEQLKREEELREKYNPDKLFKH